MQARLTRAVAWACWCAALSCQRAPSPSAPLDGASPTPSAATDAAITAADAAVTAIDGAGPELELGASSGRWLDEGPAKTPPKLSPGESKRLKEELKAKLRQGRITEMEWQTLQKLCEENGDKTCP